MAMDPKSSLIFQAQRRDWDFRRANTKEGTHAIHPYPAMMIPPVAEGLISLLHELSPRATRVLDPFCGAGTVLVEALRQGFDVTGIDLNPLAVFISSVRTTPIPLHLLNILEDQVAFWTTRGHHFTPSAVPDFQGLDFWFKPDTIRNLATLRYGIEHQTIRDPRIRQLALTAFSETVRMASNTRKNEFKLHRMAEEQLINFHPDVFAIFQKTLGHYIQALKSSYDELRRGHAWTRRGDARILDGIEDRAFDLMVTSPPYGDSRTTVAYGQFSRLSLEWLGFPAAVARSLDRNSLGGRSAGDFMDGKISPVLGDVLRDIRAREPRRALEVSGFYADLVLAIQTIRQKLKPGAFCAWVVANRTVKGVNLPTNMIIEEISRHCGFTRIAEIRRNIPHKRMPRINSPSNIPGQTGLTMTSEYLVILRYQGNP